MLDTVAKLIIEHPEMGKVEIQGHTDNVGGAENNLVLSQKRADAVMKYLTGTGVEAERVTAKGYGQTKPVDSNRSSKGRTNNRRVAFIIQSEAKPSGTGKALPKPATDQDLASEPVQITKAVTVKTEQAIRRVETPASNDVGSPWDPSPENTSSSPWGDVDQSAPIPQAVEDPIAATDSKRQPRIIKNEN